MLELPNCPKCNSEYTYQDNNIFICPNCSYEWTNIDIEKSSIKDSNGNILNSGDSVIIIRDLKVKGVSNSIKKGTKVKNIKIIEEPSDEHNIDCKIDGFGAIKLKSSVVKKV